jgi:hypothetical protein
MFLFDVETLGKETNSVVLSMACIYFEADDTRTHEEMRRDAFFVKIDVKDQITRLKRSVTKSTMEWWAKQSQIVKDKSVNVKPDDVKIEDAIEMFRAYANKHDPDKKAIVWARGNLDQMVLDAVEEQLGVEPVFFYNRWRDVRTAVDFITNSTTGYCDVDFPGFDPYVHIYKHDPVDDCVYDIMMLVHGKNKE